MRKLKLIGLSALAVLAVSAVSASAAHAATEGTAVVSAGTTGYHAVQTGTGHTFTLEGGKVLACTTATFSGTITNNDKTVTATPIYSGCTAKIGADTLTATVNMGSCDYFFSDLTTIGVDSYSALTDIVCPTTDIIIKIYQKGKAHEDINRLCEITVGAQTGLKGVDFIDNTNGTININATSVGVKAKRLFGTTTNCGEVNQTAVYNGNTLATANSGTLALDD
jgi:phosphate-selective porin